MLTLSDLTILGAQAPIGIRGDNLTLSWKLVSDQPNTRQAAYHIRAESNGDVLLDTGLVESDQSVALPWMGNNLTSGQKVDWQVSVWDNHGNQATAHSRFETGLLSPDNHMADFIEPPTPQDPKQRHPAPYFRHAFIVEKPVASARLYATAHGVYEARLNGKAVSDALFTPGFTVYDKRLQVQSFDVSKAITQGRNCLGAIVTDGWFRGCHGGGQLRNSFGTQLALWAQLEITFEDGSIQRICTDESWQIGEGAIRLCDLHWGMEIDAALEPQGWDTAEFEEHWPNASVMAHDKSRLVPQDGPLSHVVETRGAKRILTTPDGSTVVDFGQNLVGHVTLRVSGPKGHQITLTPVEVLNESGNIYPYTTLLPLDLSVADEKTKKRVRLHEWKFKLAGDGEEHFDTRHTFTGFQYVKVENWPGDLKIEDITAHIVHSDMPRTGHFKCSDTRINQLQSNIFWSQRGNFLEIPTDCPAREKAGWTGDIWGYVPTASFNQNVLPVLSRWIKDVMADQEKRGDGIVTCVSPNTRSYQVIAATDGAAAWGDAIVNVPWELYRAFGDTAILEIAYPAMCDWIDFCNRRAAETDTDKNLITTGYHWGDWLQPGKTANDHIQEGMANPPAEVSSAIYAQSLRSMSQIATLLNREDDAVHFKTRYDEVRAAYIDKFFDTDGRMTPDRQHAYVLALAMGLVPDGKEQQAADRLAELVRANGNKIDTGFLATPHILTILSNHGHHNVAADLLMQDKPPSWLYEVDKGATTIWEAWDCIREDGKYQPASFNHYLYGSAGQWLYEQIGGLQPAAPGYKRIRFAPRPACGVTHCNTALETPYGQAAISWELDGETLSGQVIVPANTEADLALPDGTNQTVGPGIHRF